MEDHSLLDTSEGPQLVQDQFILSDLLLFAILTFLHNSIGNYDKPRIRTHPLIRTQ